MKSHGGHEARRQESISLSIFEDLFQKKLWKRVVRRKELLTKNPRVEEKYEPQPWTAYFDGSLLIEKACGAGCVFYDRNRRANPRPQFHVQMDLVKPEQTGRCDCICSNGKPRGGGTDCWGRRMPCSRPPKQSFSMLVHNK